MTCWKVVPNTNGYCIHNDDKDFEHVTDICSKPIAEQIVRDHNRAEVFEAMREALEDLITACQHEKVKAPLDYYMEFSAKVVKGKNALTLADQADKEALCD